MFSNYTFLNSNIFIIFFSKFFILLFSTFLLENRKIMFETIFNFFYIFKVFTYIFIRILNFKFKKLYHTPQL